MARTARRRCRRIHGPQHHVAVLLVHAERVEHGAPALEVQRRAQLEAAGSENGDALKVWRSDLGPEPWHYRVHDALEAKP